MAASFRIAGRDIGAGFPPYVVAEMSANHNGDIERAFAIIDAAKSAGADAVKLQTYRADTITIDHAGEEFMIRGGLWDGMSLHQLYESAQMPWEWHEPLFAYARDAGITIFSSPFDESAVDLLEGLGAPAYKIASFEAIDLPLIRYTASTGKPLIISTGMANEQEIGEAVAVAREAGCGDLIVLHCVSGYPAPPQDYNLVTMRDIADRFSVFAGLSDHTVDNYAAIAAVSLGCCFIEKHVTLSREGGGPDDSFSLEPDELNALVTGVRTAWKALGAVTYERQLSEEKNAKFRRSLYVVKDIAAGDKITAAHVRSIRPGFGLAPKYYDDVIGKLALCDAAYGTPVTWSLVR